MAEHDMVSFTRRQVELAAEKLSEAENKLAEAKERYNEAFQEQLVGISYPDSRGDKVWPRRVAVAANQDGFGELPENLAYFGCRICDFLPASTELDRFYDFPKHVMLYFDVDENGSGKLVGVRQDGVVSFGDCRGGVYTDVISRDPEWQGGDW